MGVDGGTFAGSNVPVKVQGLSGVTAATAGKNHSLALKNNGTVWAWGGWSVPPIGSK